MIINNKNEDNKQPTNNSNQFTVEFYAYNFSSQGLMKKVYYFPTLLKNKKSISLSSDEISLLSEVLNNRNLLSFKPDIYTLCDLSMQYVTTVY